MLDFLEERKSRPAVLSSELVWKASSAKSFLVGCHRDCALTCHKTPSKGNFRREASFWLTVQGFSPSLQRNHDSRGLGASWSHCISTNGWWCRLGELSLLSPFCVVQTVMKQCHHPQLRGVFLSSLPQSRNFLTDRPIGGLSPR